MADTLLRQYFPLIRTREEILELINKEERLFTVYRDWNHAQQEHFLDFCTGAKGVKVLYDSFFKFIFNPDIFPHRLETLLSLLLHEHVKIVQVLPNNDTRLTDENSLLILDIVVQLQNGSLANIECQKIGYNFPGERCACYSADLLLRQYARVKNETKKRFTYRDIKSVYTIVFLEKSTKAFHEFPNDYIHHFRQTSDTGLELNMLQEFIMIPLDNFARIRQNKKVNTFNQLEAWMTFLSTDEPEMIIDLITHFPEFKPLYKDIYELCQNTEQVMHMYSKELQLLDNNTVHLMLDEMQAEIETQRAELENNKMKLAEKDNEISEKNNEISEKDSVIAKKDNEITKKDNEIAELKRQLAAHGIKQ